MEMRDETKQNQKHKKPLASFLIYRIFVLFNFFYDLQLNAKNLNLQFVSSFLVVLLGCRRKKKRRGFSSYRFKC